MERRGGAEGPSPTNRNQKKKKKKKGRTERSGTNGERYLWERPIRGAIRPDRRGGRVFSGGVVWRRAAGVVAGGLKTKQFCPRWGRGGVGRRPSPYL